MTDFNELDSFDWQPPELPSDLLQRVLALWRWVDDLRRGRPSSGIRNYLEAALRQECNAVAGTPVGTGLNEQLARSAYAIGGYVQPGALTFEEAFTALYQAAQQAGANDPPKDKGTIKRQLKAGSLKPRDLSTIGTEGAVASPAIDISKKIIDRASEITPRPVEWLWPGVVPLGKLTTFAGVGGLGKTFVLLDITARVTAGFEWPCSGGLKAPQGQVLFVSGEDDPDDTLVPRLIELGADLNRVTFLKPEVQNRFSLKDLKTLQAALEQTGSDVRLIVIDPPTAYLGGIDDHKNAELRGLLSPLSTFVSHHRVASIFNTHVNKQVGKVDAMMRVMGSVAWVNAVRAAHLFVRDPENPERRFFLPMKMNLAKERKGLAYKIEPSGTLAKVQWLGEVDTTADEAVRESPKEKQKKDRIQQAVDWLIERFREQREWSSEAIFARGHQEGISRNSIFDAKKVLDLPKAKKLGGDSYVWWVPENWTHLQPEKCRTPGTPESNGCPV